MRLATANMGTWHARREADAAAVFPTRVLHTQGAFAHLRLTGNAPRAKGSDPSGV
jgi:hypothetical protein